MVVGSFGDGVHLCRDCNRTHGTSTEGILSDGFQVFGQYDFRQRHTETEASFGKRSNMIWQNDRFQVATVLKGLLADAFDGLRQFDIL